jgi:putative ABC transport system permease protein
VIPLAPSSPLAIVELGAGQLALAAALILANAAISLRLQLGLERRLLVASLRTVVQLALLGLVLQWVFDREEPWVMLAVMLAMALVAGFEAVRRTEHRAPGVYPASLGVVLVSSMLVTFYGLLAVVRVDWHEPQYAIPILGMVLGNTLTGISLGLETALAGFAAERERIEVLLAHGATRAEASRDVVRRAVRTGMVPILNSMIAVGIVSIPGMMTGQILAGEDPADAGRYQIFILFLIASGTAIGTASIVLIATRLVFDERDRLRAERIRTVRG